MRACRGQIQRPRLALQCEQLVALVVARHLRLHQRAGRVAMRQGQIQARHQLIGRAAGQHTACLQQHQVGGKPRHLVG
ncbi:hypothetical protein SDC9_177174 [bioreactor metagenome]|uniref:Uncharacterized protein n=1 Tax=bioreactor metagenome TaxID=1076179 RepID=A0A645GS93_9ZZZZ